MKVYFLIKQVIIGIYTIACYMVDCLNNENWFCYGNQKNANKFKGYYETNKN